MGSPREEAAVRRLAEAIEREQACIRNVEIRERELLPWMRLSDEPAAQNARHSLALARRVRDMAELAVLRARSYVPAATMDRFVIQDAYYHVQMAMGTIGDRSGSRRSKIQLLHLGMNEARSQGVNFADIDGRKLSNARVILKRISETAREAGIDAYTGELLDKKVQP